MRISDWSSDVCSSDLFEEGHRLFAFEPQLDRIEGHHAVDREMRADFLKQLDIAELAEPVLIVDHHRIGRAVAEAEELLKDAEDRRDVRRDRRIRQHLAAFVAAGRSEERRVGKEWVSTWR